MDCEQLKRLITAKLNEKGLAVHVVKDKGLLLDLPEGFLVEIVLDDAARIDDASQALAEVETQVKSENEKLDYIVRPLWEVEEVGLASQSAPEGIDNLMRQGNSSLPFIATLKSGKSVRKDVYVEMTPSAYRQLRRLGQATDEDSLREVVGDFLKKQLSFGGISYWDPIKRPRQQLNDGGVLHLHYHPVPAEKGTNLYGQREV